MKDIVIIGGGIVGLSTAFRLLEAHPSLKVVVLEKETRVAAHQTGHNSGVIHSGIYYKPGSLKAKNCIEGYQQLLDFCKKEDIQHDVCGKIIVATDEGELPQLDMIFTRGQQNGLNGLRYISKAEIGEIEPHCSGIKGIWVPQTGIVDYVGMAERLAERIRERGGEVRLNEKVTDIRQNANQIEVVTNDDSVYACRVGVACAGLWADRIAEKTGAETDFKIIPFRGEYYEIVPEKQFLVKNLIYPVPNPAFPFLGVHFTRMAKGGVEAGPNAVLAFRREGYKKTDVDLGELFETLAYPGFQKIAMKYWRDGLYEMYRSWSKAAFVKALQKLIPEIHAEDLVPGGAGIRAQACGRDGSLVDDFLILEKGRFVNVCNAPSPAATSGLSIGKTVADLALAKLG